MFLTSTGGYTRHGDQYARGDFLWLVQDPAGDSRNHTRENGTVGKVPVLRALVLKTRMRQLGHWMMARVKVASYHISLSGTYGSDGLPDSLRQHFSHGKAVYFTPEEATALFSRLHDVPEDLQTAFWKGGGHNTSGSEGPLLRQWGLDNINILRKLKAKVKA